MMNRKKNKNGINSHFHRQIWEEKLKLSKQFESKDKILTTWSKQNSLMIPNAYGCYLFYNQKKELIYVGKAKNIRKRVNQYFLTSSNSKFQQQIYFFSFVLVKNEKESLVLEQNLIKNYQPRFNILLRDDHYYPYLEITAGNNPCYKLVRKIDFSRKSEYFGPFPDGSKAYEMLRLLESLFPLAKCKGNLGKPCFYYTISQCSGHCWKIVPSIYYENVKKEIQNFFLGKTRKIKQKLKKSLQKSIEQSIFEVAKKEKKLLDRIELFTSKQNIEFINKKNFDFLGIFDQKNFVAFCLFIYRYGKLFITDEATFTVWTSLDDILESYLYQFYQNNLAPHTLFFSKKFPKASLIGERFSFDINIALRGQKKEIIELANKNAQQVWKKNYLSNFQQISKNQTLIEISKFLNISLPNYIECLDISNLYNKIPVAGFLVFSNGEKDLAKSKLYRLNENILGDDLKWIKEACSIHYQKKNKFEIPDLIIVDGSKEQVKAVKSSLKELKIKTNVIGLVKNEKHQTAKLINNNLKELNLETNRRIKNFFTDCQEAVHHYAIRFHQKLYRKKILN